MNDSERLMKRLLTWGLGACIVVPGVVLAGMAVVDHARAYALDQRFATLTPEQRVDRLYQVGYKRDWRLAARVRETLETTQHREELQAAGYAAMRLGDAEALAGLQQRVDDSPDDAVRATLILYAARLADRDARVGDWLEAGTRSEQPWRQVGSAAGLLYLGRVEAAPLLLTAIRGADPEIARFAWRELSWATGPMAQAIGRPMQWIAPDKPPTDPALLDGVEQFWRDHVTLTLLNDVVRRLTLRDPDWAEMGRLLHARDRVAKLLQ